MRTFPENSLTTDQAPKYDDISIAVHVDARGDRCPMPLLKLKQGLHRMLVGEVLEILATDRGSIRDFQAYLKQSPHDLLLLEDKSDSCRYLVRKGMSSTPNTNPGQ